MKSLTPQQLADILLQKPERVTANILAQRGKWEQWKDETLVWNDTSRDSNDTPGPIEKLRRRLLTHFESAVRVAEEHPRSLRHAIMELKALGFSNAQIAEIKIMTQRLLSQLTDRGVLGDALKKDHPGCSHGLCDWAFLGAALTGPYGSYESGSESLEQYTERKNRMNNDLSATKNTILTEEQETGVAEYLPRHIESEAKLGRLDLLQPTHPRPHFTTLTL